MGKRHINFALGAGAPAGGQCMGHEVRGMRWRRRGTCDGEHVNFRNGAGPFSLLHSIFHATGGHVHTNSCVSESRVKWSPSLVECC